MARPFVPYHEGFGACCLDMLDTVKAPRVLAYEGLPRGMAAPSMGSHDEIGLRQACLIESAASVPTAGLMLRITAASVLA
jgi:hypothetical protein